MQRKLQLSVLSSDSLPSPLCPGLAEQCRGLHSAIGMGLMMLICGGGQLYNGEGETLAESQDCGDQDSHILQKELGGVKGGVGWGEQGSAGGHPVLWCGSWQGPALPAEQGGGGWGEPREAWGLDPTTGGSPGFSAN